jgi:hypothetical protein
MPDSDKFPTVTQWISDWLGVQLPTVPMPQTVRNFDKAVGRILLAAGENVEARIKVNTAKAKARGKIDVEGLYRTEEERRKIENRASTTRTALEEMRANPSEEDAQSEIDDDWLNFFARLAEDKSSEELQSLFARILAGEVRRPGSFSLRTTQTIATLSKSDAEKLSKLLSFAVIEQFIPFATADIPTTDNGGPSAEARLFLTELGVAGNPSRYGGVQMNLTAVPNNATLFDASHGAIMVINQTPEVVTFSILGQVLTGTGRELIKIANPPATDIEFLKNVAQQIMDNLRSVHSAQIESGQLKVQVVTPTQYQGAFNVIFAVDK